MSGVDRQALAAMAKAAPLLQNGVYTVHHPGMGKHYTVKVYSKDFAQQDGTSELKRIIALLTGPNNQTDFRGAAFWDEGKRRAFVWKRYASDTDKRQWPLDGSHWPSTYNKVERKIAVFLSLAVEAQIAAKAGRTTYWQQEGYELLHEGRCLVCNRPLTDPESVLFGVGPTCAEKYLPQLKKDREG